jgi:predicted metal-dependent HD superfamily phosphohydrolase
MPHPSKETLETMRPSLERSRMYQEISLAAGGKFGLFTFKKMNEVISAYREDWRHHHDIKHPLAMLDVFRKLDLSFLRPHELQAIRFMIIYHDVVYEIGKERGWNEEQSMEFAERHLRQAGIDSLILDMVLCGIKATIDHSLALVPEAWRIPISIFLDIDLFVGLGETYEQFLEITERVKREYLKEYTPEKFDAGRKKWARSMLEKETIFHSGLFIKYEPVVRKNLWRFVEE